AGFDVERVARFNARKVEQLLGNPGIVRNRLKVESAVKNARAFRRVQDEFGSFAAYQWRFVDGQPRQNRPRALKDIPAKTDESDAILPSVKTTVSSKGQIVVPRGDPRAGSHPPGSALPGRAHRRGRISAEAGACGSEPQPRPAAARLPGEGLVRAAPEERDEGRRAVAESLNEVPRRRERPERADEAGAGPESGRVAWRPRRRSGRRPPRARR